MGSPASAVLLQARSSPATVERRGVVIFIGGSLWRFVAAEILKGDRGMSILILVVKKIGFLIGGGLVVSRRACLTMFMKRTSYRLLAAILTTLFGLSAARPVAADPVYLSPSALAASPDGQRLFIACATADQVALVSTSRAARSPRPMPVPATPTGLALSPDGARLYVTCAAPASRVCVVDTAGGQGDRAPSRPGTRPWARCSARTARRSLSATGSTTTSASSTWPAKKEVRRDPGSARAGGGRASRRDGKFLLVANHLHSGRADADYVAAVVSVIDVAAGQGGQGTHAAQRQRRAARHPRLARTASTPWSRTSWPASICPPPSWSAAG